jgi:hypothetical protein
MKKYEVHVWDDRTEWFYEGKRHRDDGPAKEYANGDKFWYRDDKLHRDDGPAVEKADGYKEWYRNDKLHRDDGPAIEYANGNKYWYKNGKLHRDDGPAVECANGHKKWWIDGKKVTPKAEQMSLTDIITYKPSKEEIEKIIVDQYRQQAQETLLRSYFADLVKTIPKDENIKDYVFVINFFYWVEIKRILPELFCGKQLIFGIDVFSSPEETGITLRKMPKSKEK